MTGNESEFVSETEFIKFLDRFQGKTFEVVCVDGYRIRDLFWLKGDVYTLTGSQILERFYMNLPGFMAHFRPKNKAAQDLFFGPTVEPWQPMGERIDDTDLEIETYGPNEEIVFSIGGRYYSDLLAQPCNRKSS